MIGLIVRLLSGTVVKYLLGAAAIGAAWLWVKTHYEGKGRLKERAEIVEAGKANARKADAARRRVDKIPDSGLRDRYFRD